MATGDDAVAAGMALVLGSRLANEIDTADNETRDYLANGPKHWLAGVRVPWARLTDIPATFTPAAHLHSSLDQSGARFGFDRGNWATNQGIFVAAASAFYGSLNLPNVSRVTTGYAPLYINGGDGRIGTPPAGHVSNEELLERVTALAAEVAALKERLPG